MANPRKVPAFHATSQAPGLDVDPTVRKYIGDGTPLLMVPNCIEVTDVFVGQIPLPASEIVTVPIDTSHKNFEEQEHPLWTLEKTENGDPVLLRSLRSNDGIWQSGASIYVRGKWSDDKPAKK